LYPLLLIVGSYAYIIAQNKKQEKKQGKKRGLLWRDNFYLRLSPFFILLKINQQVCQGFYYDSVEKRHPRGHQQ
jgi:hypothetical protein